MIASEKLPYQPPQGREVLQLIDDMVPEAAEELAYDVVGDTEEQMLKLDVGLMWDIESEFLRSGESVRIGVCHEEGRYRLGELLKSTYGIEALPMAFLELKVDKDVASFSSSVYVLESGDIVAHVDTSIEDEDSLSEDSEACFEFADHLGYSRIWTKAMFAAQQSGRNVTSELVTLDQPQTTQLFDFLNTLADRV